MNDTDANEKWPLWHIVATMGLIINVALIVISLWSALFGPRKLLMLGTLGFMVGWCCIAVGISSKRVKRALPAAPASLLRTDAGSVIPKYFDWLIGIIGAMAMLGVLVLFASARDDGVADFPAFEHLPKYELNSHGKTTEVSRLRYIIVSASFAIGWHSGAALMSLACLYRLLCGRVPAMFATDKKREPNRPDARDGS